MTKPGVALIGLGPASQPHARSLMDLKDRVDVRWAASRSTERVRDFAERYAFPTTTDLDAVIADPGVDAVILLTPPSAHLELAERCFAAGKHVLVEKPLEVSLERASRLVEAARRHNRRLGVVLQHRFRPAGLRVREIIRDGRLGPIEAATIAVPWWRPQIYYDEPGRGTLARDGGGVLLTQAIHSFDLFRSLVDVREVISAIATTTGLHRMETEDFVAGLLRLRNGTLATLMATTAFYPGHPERIEIIGRLGAATINGGALHVAYLDGQAETVASDGGTGSGASIMDFPHDAHRALIGDFLDAIQQDRDPVVSGEEALATQRLINAVLQAAAQNSAAPRAALTNAQ
jgi:predicted dehydrogenase